MVGPLVSHCDLLQSPKTVERKDSGKFIGRNPPENVIRENVTFYRIPPDSRTRQMQNYGFERHGMHFLDVMISSQIRTP